MKYKKVRKNCQLKKNFLDIEGANVIKLREFKFFMHHFAALNARPPKSPGRGL
jgi:hypothetical protein